MGTETNLQSSNRYDQAVDKLLASPETNIEFCRELFWALEVKSCDRQKKIGRWAIYGIISICFFELLNRRFVINASLTGIQINRINFLVYFLPPAVAFSVLNIFTLAYEQSHYERIMRALAKQKFPGLHASKIGQLFSNASGLLSNDIPSTFTTRLGTFNNLLYTGIQLYLVIIGGLIFEIYAYMQLFTHARHFNIAAVISLLVTMSFAVMSVLLYADADVDTNLIS